MKLSFMRLKNFIGVHVGLGIKEIEIPFYQGDSKICMVLGANGSGKSTILDNAIPLPHTAGHERTKLILEGLDGEKEMWYDRGPLKYKILIKYNWNNSTGSHLIKAFITRIDGVDEVELNPNGNVTSYKEILEVEFMLDPSFLRLCRLSQESVNITRMKATERKSVVASLLSEVEVYAEYNKKMNEHCKTINSGIKTLATKMDRIGDISDIDLKLVQIENQVLEYNLEKDNLNDEISKNKGKLSSIDLSGYTDAKRLLDNAKNRLKKFDKELSDIREIIPKEVSSIEDLNIINEFIVKTQVEMGAMKSKMTHIIEENKNNRSKLENSMYNLNIQSKKIKDVETGYSITDLENSIKLYEDELADIEYKLRDVQDVFSSSTLIKAQDQLQLINSAIHNALHNTDHGVISQILDSFQRGNVMGYKSSCARKFDTMKAIEGSYVYKKLPAASGVLSELKSKLELRENLSKRPYDCEVDSCPFISEALGLGDVESDLKQAELDYKILLNKYEDAKRSVEKLDSAIRVCDSYNYIYNLIRSNATLFRNIPNGHAFTINSFTDRMRTGLLGDSDFDLTEYITAASLNERHVDITDSILPNLIKELKLAKQTDEVLIIIQVEIDRLKTECDEYSVTINDNNQKCVQYELDLSNLSNLNDYLKDYYDILIDISDTKIEIDRVFNECSKYNSQLIEVARCEEEIKSKSKEVDGFIRMISGLSKDRDSLTYQSKMYAEYQEERLKLEETYVVYETIRHGLTNKDGIPLVFIKLYLEGTRLIANKILAKVANGDFKLLNFVITPTEFIIPCEVRGEVVTDISMMSGGERAIIAIILSLTLMHQSSSSGSYNIISLDEMDAVLDVDNKMAFIEVLEELMDIFEIDQVLAISHNVGFESYPVDLVLLRDYKLENTDNKTIIFKHS
ncbi:MAG: hypothetical protein ACRC0G_07120 [Fusobacteriaceae bacterium]